MKPPVVLRATVLLLLLIFQVPLLGSEPAPLDADEALLASLNCGVSDVTSGWGPVAHWTRPGSFALPGFIRAYYATSYAAAAPDVSSVVCHLVWYSSHSAAEVGFKDRADPRRDSDLHFSVADRSVVQVAVIPPYGNYRPGGFGYNIILQRGPFLFWAGMFSTTSRSAASLEAFSRLIDERLAPRAAQLPVYDPNSPLLKNKLVDPSRAPKCVTECPRHHERLVPVLVRIAYGLQRPVDLGPAGRAWEDSYVAAKSALFPHSAPSFLDGGCTIDGLADEDWSCACATCTTAERKWRTDHPVGSH